MYSENGIISKLPLLLYGLVFMVPFLWNSQALIASTIYKYMAIETAAVVSAVLVLHQLMRSKNTIEFTMPAIGWPIIGLYVMAMLSVLWAIDAGAALVPFVHMSGLFILFALVAYATAINPVHFPLMLVRVAVAAAAGLSLLGLLQNFAVVTTLFPQANAPAGTMINKNILAQYLDTMLFPALMMIFWEKDKRVISMAAFAFAVLLALLLVTYTRGAWLGGIIGLFILLGYLKFHPQNSMNVLAHDHLKYKYMSVLLAVIMAVVVMLLPSPVNKGLFKNKFYDAVTQPEEGVAALRVALYMNSWQMFIDNPLGVGLGNWRNAYPEYHQAARNTPGYGVKMQPRELHCDPFLFFVESGVFGGLFFVCLLLLLIRTVWRMLALKIHSSQQRLLLLSLFLSLMGVGVHSFFSFPFKSPASAMLIWVWLGVIAGLSVSAAAQGAGAGLLTRTFQMNRLRTGFLFICMLFALVAMVFYQAAHLKGAELEMKSYLLFQAEKKCIESLPVIDEAVSAFPYSYTANMRKSLFHQACDPDRVNAFEISKALLEKEPYYLNMLNNLLPSALQIGRLDVVSDVATRMVNVFPDLPVGYHWQGMIEGGQGHYKKAMKLFSIALEKDAAYQPSKEMLEKMEGLISAPAE